MELESDTDADLMRRARHDPRAFDAVYVRHARQLHAWLRRRLDDDSHAWELTAEVFAQAWISRRRFRPDETGNMGPWLQGIAVNVLRHDSRRRWARARATRRLGMEVDLTGSADEDEHLERMAVEAVGPELRASLGRLPAAQRLAIQLRVLDDLPYEEIATRLDCTPDTVRMRVMRGLRTLNTDLRGQLP
ncbi:MAG: polymerase, sigma-24 subunit, subfamily [Thermoleophilia bacterium]|nr:polymerase, sigma-24 subunit, subfamily [Thermoleophilia bacterium]